MKKLALILPALILITGLLTFAPVSAETVTIDAETELMPGISSQGDGWSYDAGFSTLTIDIGADVKIIGTYTGTVKNNGTLSGGTFNGDAYKKIINNGTISGGDFIGLQDVTNNAGATISGGSFAGYGAVINDGTIINGTNPPSFNNIVYNYGTISGGTFATVTNKSTITAVDDNNYPTFNGEVTNEKVILGGKFNDTVTNYTGSTISGGTFDCPVDNGGTISGGIFKKDMNNYRNIGGGNGVGGKITGGEFDGKVVGSYNSEISGGLFNGEVYIDNGSIITDGKFKNNVVSSGLNAEIKGGIFDGEVFNGQDTESGGIAGTQSASENTDFANGLYRGAGADELFGTISGGEFNNTVKNNTGSIISGGTFSGQVNNYGTITAQSETAYPTFSGRVENYSVISGGMFNDVTGATNDVLNLDTINGGTFNGEVSNGNAYTQSGTITNGVFKNKVTNNSKGYISGGLMKIGSTVENGGIISNLRCEVQYTIGGNSELITEAVYGEDYTYSFTGKIPETVTLTSANAEGVSYADGVLTVEKVLGAMEFEGTYPTYAITVTADNGTASADKTEAEAGEEITLTATADEGYEFAGWEIIPDSVVITDNKFTMPAEEVTIKAVFSEIPKYTITVNAVNGTVTGGGVYIENSDVILTATADDGYEFVNWTENGAAVSASATYTFKVTADRTLTANFKEKTVPHTHVYGGWISDENGHWHECTDAGCPNKAGSQKDYALHTPDNGTIVKEPTTDSEGEKVFKCTVCGRILRTEAIDKLPSDTSVSSPEPEVTTVTTPSGVVVTYIITENVTLGAGVEEEASRNSGIIPIAVIAVICVGAVVVSRKKKEE